MPSTSQPPQPMPAPANPSRPPPRKMSTSSALRVPQYASRTGQSPMSFGAAMSGVSFTNGGGGGGYSYGKNVPGSFGARFYGDAGDSPQLFDSPQLPFGQSITMDNGSFVASSAAFGLLGNSYTRRSYAAAAGGREYSPAMLSASLASLTTHPMGSLGHSYSRGQLETLMSRRNEAEYTKEYECCGLQLHGLHALLEHVEDQHPYSDTMPDAGFSPVTLAMDLDFEGDMEGVPSASQSTRSSTSPRPMPNYPLTPTSTAGSNPKPEAPVAQPPSTVSALQLSDVLKSPATDDSNLPPLSIKTGLLTDSAPPPKITSASRSAFLSGPARTGQQRFDRAFNEVVAGNKTGQLDDPSQPPGPTAVAPSVLFSSGTNLGIPTAPAVVGRTAGNAGSGPSTPTQEKKEEDLKEEPKDAEASKMPEPQLPQPSLFTTHKAWRCPNPGCNKAYKQSNGLKYHLQKGQCDFAIHDAIDNGLTLEEAEERARPYVCAVGAGCTKRYRQMNGLKYHYLNSGEHGQYGLRMLQNGTHPQPPHHPALPKRDRVAAPRNTEVPAAPTPANPAHTTHATAHASRAAAAPYAIPSQLQRPAAAAHQPAPRMGTWPAQQRPAGSPAPGTPGAAPARAQAATPANGSSGANGLPHANGTHAPPRPAQPQQAQAQTGKIATPKLPVQRGRDAVLFSAVDMDV